MHVFCCPGIDRWVKEKLSGRGCLSCVCSFVQSSIRMKLIVRLILKKLLGQGLDVGFMA